MVRKTLSILLIIVMLFQIVGVTLQKHICQTEQSEEIVAVDGISTIEEGSGCSCLAEEAESSGLRHGFEMQEQSCCATFSSYLHFDYKSEFPSQLILTFESRAFITAIVNRDDLLPAIKVLQTVLPNFHSPPLSGAEFVIAVHQIKIPGHC